MSKKLTSSIALDFVKRIEALEDQVAAVYREASDYDGINNVNVIREIVNARKEVVSHDLTHPASQAERATVKRRNGRQRKQRP